MQPSVRVYRWAPRLHCGLRARFSTGKPVTALQQDAAKIYTSEREPQRRKMGMWLANDSSALDSGKILKELPRLSSNLSDHIHLAVFMVTPQFAHLVDEGSPFLESAMSSIFGPQPGLSSGSTLRSVVGIVDKLPGDKFGPKTGAPLAHEGVAYLLSSGENIDTEPQGDTRGLDAPPSLVRLLFQPDRVPVPDTIESAWRCVVTNTTSIAVPLANTLFVNGRQSTLIETIWTSSDSGALTRGSSTPLGAVNIRLPHGTNALHRRFPLRLLTPPRTVASAMGNVLRSVEIGGVDVPASKELEEVIATGILQPHSDGSRPQVYAVITPESIPNLSEDHLPSHWTLLTGKGFYRVSGGGGGWGQKQGLLSLDPTQTYTPATGEVASADLIDKSDEGMADFLESRKSMVHTGDRVSFWAEHTDMEHLLANTPSVHRLFGWNDGQIRQSLLLGVVPRPEKNAQRVSDDDDTVAVVSLKGSFGLLSEKGLAFDCDGFREARATEDTRSMNEPSKNDAGENRQKFHHQVVLEVPGAWVASNCWSMPRERKQLVKEAKKYSTQQLQQPDQRGRQQEPESYKALMRGRPLGGSGAGSKAKAAPTQGKQENEHSQQPVQKKKWRDRGPRDVIFHVDVPQPDQAGSHEENTSEGGFARLDQPLEDDSEPGQSVSTTNVEVKPTLQQHTNTAGPVQAVKITKVRTKPLHAVNIIKYKANPDSQQHTNTSEPGQAEKIVRYVHKPVGPVRKHWT